VELEIWYSYGDTKLMEFVRKLKPYYMRLGNKMLMTPHIITRRCQGCSQSEIDKDCIKVKKESYCAPIDMLSALAGTDVLRGGLQELCLNKLDRKHSTDIWWRYFDAMTICKDRGYKWDCAKEVINGLPVLKQELEKCLQESDNMLVSEAEEPNKAIVMYSPSIIINNQLYKALTLSFNLIGIAGGGAGVSGDLCWIQRDAGGVRCRLWYTQTRS
jgi:hypothetical protein